MMAMLRDSPRPRDATAVAAIIGALAARFGDRLVTAASVREQHANTTTWVPNEPADAVVYVQTTQDVQDVVELVVLEHGDDAPRPRGPLHPAQGVHGVGQAVEALGAPDQVKGFLGDRRVPQIGHRERHAIGELARRDLPLRQLQAGE